MRVSQRWVCNPETRESQPHSLGPLLGLLDFMNNPRPKGHFIKYINGTKAWPIYIMYVWQFQQLFLFYDLPLFIFRQTSDICRPWRQQPRNTYKTNGLHALIAYCVHLVGLVILHFRHYDFHVVSITSFINNAYVHTNIHIQSHKPYYYCII